MAVMEFDNKLEGLAGLVILMLQMEVKTLPGSNSYL
jgi:hypothetical protein